MSDEFGNPESDQDPLSDLPEAEAIDEIVDADIVDAAVPHQFGAQPSAPFQHPALPGNTAQTGNALIPTGNPKALTSYYLGVFSLVVCLAPVLSPLAIFLGTKGLRAYRENPDIKGSAHAIVGIVLGSITLVMALGVGILVAVAAMNR